MTTEKTEGKEGESGQVDLDRSFFKLDAQTFDNFQQALDEPRKPNVALRALFRKVPL